MSISNRMNGNVSISRSEDTFVKTHLQRTDQPSIYEHIEFLEIALNDFVNKPMSFSANKRHSDFIEKIARSVPKGIDVRFKECSLNYSELLMAIDMFTKISKCDIQVTINPLHVTSRNIDNVKKICETEFPFLFVKYNSHKDLELIDKLLSIKPSMRKINGIVVEDDNKYINNTLLEKYQYITYNDNPITSFETISETSKNNQVFFMYKIEQMINMSISHNDYDEIEDIIKCMNFKK